MKSSHMNNNYHSYVEHKTDSSQSQSTCRTPIAWHNRSLNFSKPLPPSVQTVVDYKPKYRLPSAHRSQRPSSPSATTTSSDDREEVPMVRHHMRRPNSRVTTSSALTVDRRQQMVANKFGNHMTNTMISGDYSFPMHAIRNGTLRSTKSVPALAMTTTTINGDMCPVHGNGLLMHTCHPFYPTIQTQYNVRRFGSYGDIRDIRDIRETRIPISGNGLSILAPIPENKPTSCGALMPVYYSQQHTSVGHSALPALSAPNHLTMQSQMQLMSPKTHHMPPTRSMVFPAYAEPLPFRSHYKVSSPVPSQHTVKIGDNYGAISDDICCRGHLIVLWVILGVVTVGVISGIILAVTLN